MSQETPIGNLTGGISEEDAKLVDSILNDIGQGSQQSQQTQPVQHTQPVQQQTMSQEQQALLAQQQALQQQAMQQQAMHQQAMQKQMKGPQIAGGSGTSIADSIKCESKSIMVIIVLSIAFNMSQVNALFKKIPLFLGKDGALNLQCVFVKALLIGVIYFLIKNKLS